LLVLLGLALSGCSSLGNYTWYTEVPRSEWLPDASEYVIATGDVITVRVFDQENLAAHGKVRSDGRITVPFAGEVVAVGKTPLQLGKDIETKLKVFIVSPRVLVNVDETSPIVVSMLGEVGAKGNLTLLRPSTLLQVLAQAGGPTEFANKEAIFLVRQRPVFRRIRFTYDALLNNENGAAAFQVRSGDVIVVQ
jgi:polysaccharide export outer membrane protein